MDIKDFINEGQKAQQKTQLDIIPSSKNKKNIEIKYETILENDSDFVIERKTTSTDKMLVCILSQGLLYIKNVKTNEIENNLKEKDILNFLKDCNINDLPKKIQYKIKSREYVTKLSDYFAWAIRNLDTAKELAKMKIFCNLSNSAFNGEFNQPTTEQIKDLQWCSQFLFYMKPNDMNWNYASTIYHTYLWLKDMESAGCNKDKINYNKEILKTIEFNGFSGYDKEYSSCVEVIKIGNLDYNVFVGYLRKLFTEEFLNCSNSSYSKGFAFGEYKDYLNMQIDMYGKIKEKYPSNWLSSLRIMQQKYSIWKTLHKEEKFLKLSNKIKDLEYDNGKYCIIVPTSSGEIVDEGAHLGHCVGSYVDRILEGETTILFMRKSNKKEESLVTVEYKNGTVCQYKGYADRQVTEEENDFLKEWCKNKKIEKSERG